MKTICCFGHREILKNVDSAEEIIRMKEYLYRNIEDYILYCDASVFLTGSRGEFDAAFSFAVRRLKGKYPHIKLILVEPYFSNKFNKYKEYYESMYDSVIIPDELADVHPKQSITLRNRWIVDHSDIIFAYVDYRKGGAYEALKYAQNKGKYIFNMGDLPVIISDYDVTGFAKYEDI